MLRELTSDDDWPLWRSARLTALTDAPEAFPDAIAAWETGGQERWRAHLGDPSMLKLVAVAADEPVGLIRGRLEPDAAWIHSLWVRPDQRGTGLAQKLIRAVEDWARPHVDLIKLDVVPTNDHAIALYHRLGYQELDLCDGFLEFDKSL